MKRLQSIKEQLINKVESQMGDLSCVNTEELGEVIDMIKDLAKAIYYCEVYEQMEEAEQSRKMESQYKGVNNYYYTECSHPTYDYYRDMDKDWGMMYYSSPSHDMGRNIRQIASSQDSKSGSHSGYYTERDYPIYLRDEREGRSPMKRKMYMESKDMHHDSSKTMKELEEYMQDLTSDMMELLNKASPEEKATLQKKISTLAAKVQNV